MTESDTRAGGPGDAGSPTGGGLEQRLRGDLTAAMRARDVVARTTLRGALAAVGTEKVSGDTARELSDAEVESVLRREVRRRRESAEAFDGGARPELAAAERAEAGLLERYLPTQLADDDLRALVAEAVAEVGAAGGQPPDRRAMGAVMKAANARVAGRAEGSRVAAAVRAALV